MVGIDALLSLQYVVIYCKPSINISKSTSTEDSVARLFRITVSVGCIFVSVSLTELNDAMNISISLVRRSSQNAIADTDDMSL